jgi:hypothetical protein
MTDDDVQHEHGEDHSLAYCRNLVRILKDGGTWGIPRAGVVFSVDKKNQRLVQILGDRDHPDVRASRIVFKKIGWDVLAQEDIAGED